MKGFRMPAGFFFQLPLSAEQGIFLWMKFPCREFQNLALHWIAELPDEQRVAIRKKSNRHGASMMFDDLAHGAITRLMFHFITKNGKDTSRIDGLTRSN